MSPRVAYETEEHLQRERLFAQHIESVKGVKMLKLPISYQFDYLIGKPTEDNKYRGIGMAELKCREARVTSYPTLIVSLLKWEKGLSWLSCGLMVCFFVRYQDGDYYYKMEPEGNRETWVEWGGRTRATRDSADIEAVQCIPVRLLKELR